MVVRRGRYASFGGKEYELVLKQDGQLELLSRNTIDSSLGFRPHPFLPGLLTRVVNRAELEEYYAIESYAIYRGYAFRVESTEEEQLILHTGDEEVALRFEFNRNERGGFYKLVPPILVEQIIEEREDIKIP